MSGIDFETGEPIWEADVYHNTPGTAGIWVRAFNAETEPKAVAKAIRLFESDGLPPERITSIEISELKGDENG